MGEDKNEIQNWINEFYIKYPPDIYQTSFTDTYISFSGNRWFLGYKKHI